MCTSTCIAPPDAQIITGNTQKSHSKPQLGLQSLHLCLCLDWWSGWVRLFESFRSASISGLSMSGQAQWWHGSKTATASPWLRRPTRGRQAEAARIESTENQRSRASPLFYGADWRMAKPLPHNAFFKVLPQQISNDTGVMLILSNPVQSS